MKTLLKTCFVILFITLFNPSLFAQNLIKVGYTSPEVASFAKFGNIPVSYSTGVPNINIPIFEIKSGDIQLPISLDYHASGIKVDEISSSVGIGWALNAGGAISRSLVGLPDESASGYLVSPPAEGIINNPTGNYQYLYNVMLGMADASPDVFSFNIPNQSGRFIIKKSDHSFIQYPLSNNKIENYNNTNYKITDQNGISFIFEQREMTAFGNVNTVNLIPAYVSAWRLTQIISSTQKDTVFLNYETALNLYQHSKSYTHTLGTSYDGSLINADSYTSQSVNNSESYLKEITWKNGKIAFTNNSDRQDYEGAKRLNEVDIYSKVNGNYTLLKKVNLTQSYFFYKPNNYSDPGDPNGTNVYRLRLDRVSFSDVTGSNPQIYSMNYDSTSMAPRESAGQDVWGYNNGHFENSSLMPTQTVLFSVYESGNGYYTFGSANRNFDINYIKACTLQSITYPTGGKTVYELEPHQYNTNVVQPTTVNAESVSEGGFRSTNSTSFTLTSEMSNLRYSCNISAYNYPDVTDRPRATLTDQNTGAIVFTVNNPDPTQSYSTGLLPISNVSGPFLTVGHTYVLTTSIYTNNSNVKATLDVFYDVQNSNNHILQGGGLRIKTISNYDNTGNLSNKKTYTYGTDGSGTLLTPPQYLAITSEITSFRRGYHNNQGGANCQYQTGHPSLISHANTVVPVSQLSGSPVLYSFVTEYESNVNNGTLTNGKKDFSYQVFQDQQVLAYNQYTYGVQMVSNVWRNGDLTGERSHRSVDASNYALLKAKQHNYTWARLSTEKMIRVHPRYTYAIDDQSCETFSANAVGDDIILDGYDLPTNAHLLITDTDTLYDYNNNKTGNITSYSYDDLSHLLPTAKSFYSSKSENLNTVMKYPHDFASNGNVYQTMVNRNIIAPVVSSQQTRNANQISLTNVNYTDWFGNGNVLLPATVDAQTGNYPIQQRVVYSAYDQSGNILQQQKTNGPFTTYLWGYNNQYSVAEIKNATYQQVLNVLGQTAIDRLNNSPSDDPTVRGIINPLRAALPQAQVTTYTYQPLVGMTSMTDAKGMTIYYEYDSYQRLMNIQDKDGNVVKHLDYHYANQ